MAKVEKVNEDQYVITVNRREAETLVAVSSRIGGSSDGRRGLFSGPYPSAPSDPDNSLGGQFRHLGLFWEDEPIFDIIQSGSIYLTNEAD